MKPKSGCRGKTRSTRSWSRDRERWNLLLSNAKHHQSQGSDATPCETGPGSDRNKIRSESKMIIIRNRCDSIEGDFPAGIPLRNQLSRYTNPSFCPWNSIPRTTRMLWTTGSNKSNQKSTLITDAMMIRWMITRYESMIWIEIEIWDIEWDDPISMNR